MTEQSHFSILNYKKDTFIAVEGRQRAEFFFIVQRGSVRLSKIMEVPGYQSDTLVEGDIFGVVSAMSSKSYLETAVAVTDVVLIAVRPQYYENLIQKNGDIAMKILLQLSSRLRILNDTLTVNTIKGEVEPTADDRFSRMFEAAEYYFANKKYVQALYVYTKYLRYCPEGKKSAAAKKRIESMPRNVGEVREDYTPDDMSRVYRKGEVLFVEGEIGEELFVMQKGEVEIAKIVDNKEVLLGQLKQGDIFGEMALLENKPRTANAVATESCSVMAVNKTSFMFLTKEQPQIVSKITCLLAGRIWFNMKKLENTLIKDPLGRIYGLLLVCLEKEYVGFNSVGSYSFPFSWEDLSHMLGFAEKEGFIHMGELQQKDKNIRIVNGMIFVDSIKDLVKAAEFYRKMYEMENEKKSRQSK